MRKNSVDLTVVRRTAPALLDAMAIHYSQPRGFVGRNICYEITYEGIRYGYIVGGSATRHLPGRASFLGFDPLDYLNNLVNNIFFHVEPNDGYPIRNFVPQVIRTFEGRICQDWTHKYGDTVLALETLVELPRSGECYRRAGWTLVGRTKGYTCKRTGGEGSDGWSGVRVWDTVNLRPKHVFMKRMQHA